MADLLVGPRSNGMRGPLTATFGSGLALRKSMTFRIQFKRLTALAVTVLGLLAVPTHAGLVYSKRIECASAVRGHTATRIDFERALDIVGPTGEAREMISRAIDFLKSQPFDTGGDRVYNFGLLMSAVRKAQSRLGLVWEFKPFRSADGSAHGFSGDKGYAFFIDAEGSLYHGFLVPIYGWNEVENREKFWEPDYELLKLLVPGKPKYISEVEAWEIIGMGPPEVTLRRALNHMKELPYQSPEHRAKDMETLLHAIQETSELGWGFDTHRGTMGAYVFAGPGGRGVVVDRHGDIYVGKISMIQINRDQPWVENYDYLNKVTAPF